MRFSHKLVVFLVVAALLVACAPAPEPAAAPAVETEPAASDSAEEQPAAVTGGDGGMSIRIATQSPLSGAQSALGTALKNGAQLALEQQKDGLEAMGFIVELVPYDDQASADTGLANAKQIVADPSVLCVVGHLNSGVTIPASEEYHNANLSMISPSSTNPTVTDRGYLEINRVVGRDDVQGVVAEQFAREELGVKSVYIVHDKTSYGQGVAEYFRKAAESNGMQVVGFEGTEEQANFDSIITPILAVAPDLIYFGGVYSQGGIFFKQVREKGITAQFMGPDGMDSPELVNLGGDSVVDLHYTSIAGPASECPATEQFMQDYEARFGEPSQPFTAQAFDAMSLCVASIEQAAQENGGAMPSRAQVTTALRSLKEFPGVTGSITFNAKGDPVQSTYFVLQVKASDADSWNNNQIIKKLEIAAPQ